MTVKEMDKMAAKYRKLRSMKEQIEAEMDMITDQLKAQMSETGTDTLTGKDWKAQWTFVNGTRLDTTALKKALPDLVEQYTRPNHYRRFTLA